MFGGSKPAPKQMRTLALECCLLLLCFNCLLQLICSVLKNEDIIIFVLNSATTDISTESEAPEMTTVDVQHTSLTEEPPSSTSLISKHVLKKNNN